MKAAAGYRPIDTAEPPARGASVKCAFCDGTGMDPFEVLSRLSRCPVCKGHKAVAVNGPTAACAYCRGTGRGRHTRLACSGCGGTGAIALAGPTTRCPQCGGTGREPEADLACSLCKGAGLLAKDTAQNQKKPAASERHEEP